MSLISVIIPTYNRANVLSRAINSVLAQTYTNFELIIVDDGSIDHTKKVVEKFIDQRISYFKLDCNSGQNTALNRGINIAKGEYISFLDSDDEWLPTFLEKLKKIIEEDEQIGLCYSRASGLTNDGKYYSGYKFILKGNIYKEVLNQGYLSYMITILVKRSEIIKLLPEPFDPNFIYAQDDDFCFRIAKLCKIGLVEEELAIIHNDGIVNGDEQSISRDLIKVAIGKEKLINKFKNDILLLCGPKVLASKYLEITKIYLKLNIKDQVINSIQKSLEYNNVIYLKIINKYLNYNPIFKLFVLLYKLINKINVTFFSILYIKL